MFKFLFAIMLFIAAPAFAQYSQDRESENNSTTRYAIGVVYDSETQTLTIFGDNDRDQLTAVRRAVRTHGDEIQTVHMAGPGGMFDVGLQIGLIVFENQYSVIVPDDQWCVSACAIAAAASPDLSVQGTLLFHRPFYPAIPVSASIEEISTRVGGLYMEMTEYFLNIGYGIELPKRIIALTNHCVFIEMISEREVDSFRTDATPIPMRRTNTVENCE